LLHCDIQRPLNVNREGDRYYNQPYHLGMSERFAMSPVNARMGIITPVAMSEFWLMLFEIELTMKPIPAPHRLSRASIMYMLKNRDGSS
jgi:hypothetical protein